MRIGVLGAAGQLGSDLCPRLPGDVVPLSRAEIDLTRHELIPDALQALRLDVLVNCAAYNLVDRAERERESAFAVNAWGAGALAKACHLANIRMVHFSTDYVFGLDSARTTPYAESDPPGPVNVYGLSKLTGEYLVRAECPTALVIRTCGLYGLEGTGGKGTNFVETMLRLAGEEKPIRVVNDQRCTPTFTQDLALATASLIGAGAHGLHHVTNEGSCTWHEFATELFHISGLKPNLTSIASTEHVSSVRRPGYSVLSVDRLTYAGLPGMRPWREALAAYVLERQGRKR
jgi:dTDP-4-dehydrorhamnose reductase